MARPEETDIVQAMKEAKTARDMVKSWGTQAPGRDIERSLKVFKLWIERKPEMMEVFAQNPLWRYIDHGILDPKARELVILGIIMAMGSTEGVVARVANAKGAGCTEEEMMEVAYLVCYQAGKSMLGTSATMLEEAFRATTNVKPRKNITSQK